MALPVTKVSETIVAFVAQLKQAACDAKAAGVVLELPEDMKIRVTVIAPNGLNAIARTTTQNSGEQVQIVDNPDRVETQVTGEGLTTTTADGATSTSVQTQVSPEKTSRKYEEAVTNVTERTGTPETTTNHQTQDTDGTDRRAGSGGNSATEDTTYETL